MTYHTTTNNLTLNVTTMTQVIITIKGKPITISSPGGLIEVKANINPIFLKPIQK